MPRGILETMREAILRTFAGYVVERKEGESGCVCVGSRKDELEQSRR